MIAPYLSNLTAFDATFDFLNSRFLEPIFVSRSLGPGSLVGNRAKKKFGSEASRVGSGEGEGPLPLSSTCSARFPLRSLVPG